jgi:hypothetical protein
VEGGGEPVDFAAGEQFDRGNPSRRIGGCIRHSGLQAGNGLPVAKHHRKGFRTGAEFRNVAAGQARVEVIPAGRFLAFPEPGKRVLHPDHNGKLCPSKLRCRQIFDQELESAIPLPGRSGGDQISGDVPADERMTGMFKQFCPIGCAVGAGE